MKEARLFSLVTMFAALVLVFVGCASSVGPNDGRAGDGSTTDTFSVSCTLPGGGRCPVGQSCPAEDGCNQCFCNPDGTLTCTERDCAPVDAMIPTQECRTPNECPTEQFCAFEPGCGPATIGHCQDLRSCSSLPVAPQYCDCNGMTFTLPSACPPDHPYALRGACPSVDAGTGDSTRFHGALMMWSAPGGFAGTGPAIVVTSRGAVLEWDNVGAFMPDGPYPPPSRTLHFSIAETDDLFNRWFNTPSPGLPHMVPGGNECYPSVYTRLCDTCTSRQINYNVPSAMLPEMDSVWAWFDAHTPGASPRGYCAF
jgi:hypothetical protein